MCLRASYDFSSVAFCVFSLFCGAVAYGSTIVVSMAAVDEVDLSRSRHYHALSDPRTCARRNSLCALFGQRDVETSWFGWCVMCNATWRNRRTEGQLFSVSPDFARDSQLWLEEKTFSTWLQLGNFQVSDAVASWWTELTPKRLWPIARRRR